MATNAKQVAEQPSTVPVGLDGLTEDEILDIFRLNSLSAPIRIPTRKLTADFAYRWINKKDLRVFQRRRGIGWVGIKATELDSLCKDGYTASDLHMGTHTDNDGFVALSDDLMLAKLPKRIANAIEKHRVQLSKDKLGAGKRRFHQAGEHAGVSTHEVDY